MLRKKRGHSFGSALGGGAVVAVAGLLAIATGLIGGAGGSTTTPSAVPYPLQGVATLRGNDAPGSLRITATGPVGDGHRNS